jgi:hypothetical protein
MPQILSRRTPRNRPVRAIVAGLLSLRQLWPVDFHYVVIGEQLLVFGLVGADVHVGVRLLLLRASGRPKGAESCVLGIALVLWNRRVGYIYRRRPGWIAGGGTDV